MGKYAEIGKGQGIFLLTFALEANISRYEPHAVKINNVLFSSDYLSTNALEQKSNSRFSAWGKYSL